VTHVYSDNDISASSKGGRVRNRPGFEALLSAVLDGEVEWIVATEYTRLTRNRTDEVRLVDACKDEGVSIALVRGSDIDVSTAAGRMTAEILASVARHEVEQLGERQVAANEQRARAGKPHWTIRPYGYELDGTQVESEADLIRQAYTLVLEGGTLADVRRLWGERGGPTSTGSVARIMGNPRNAGIRLYRGAEVGMGSWEPIVSTDVYRAVVSLLQGRGTPGPRQRNYLLTGLGLCGVCWDNPEGREVSTLHVGTQSKPHKDGKRRRTYRCSRKPSHLSRSLEPIEREVTVTAVGMLLGAALEGPGEDEPELIPLVTRMTELRAEAEDWARSAVGAGQATTAAARAALVELDRQMAEVDDRIADVRRSVFAWDWANGEEPPNFGELLEQWEGWPIARKQALLRDLFESIIVPGGRKPVIYTPGKRAPKRVMVPMDEYVRWVKRGGTSTVAT
jgi:DNA invertase Pin-like site-specific DNA recombinase